MRTSASAGSQRAEGLASLASLRPGRYHRDPATTTASTMPAGAEGIAASASADGLRVRDLPSGTPPGVDKGTRVVPAGFSADLAFALASRLPLCRLVAEREYRAGVVDAFAGVVGLLERFAGEVADDSAVEGSRALLLERLAGLSCSVRELGSVVALSGASVEAGFELWAADCVPEGLVVGALVDVRPGHVAGFDADPVVVAARFADDLAAAALTPLQRHGLGRCRHVRPRRPLPPVVQPLVHALPG